MTTLVVAALQKVLAHDPRALMYLDDLGRLILTAHAFHDAASNQWLLCWCRHNVEQFVAHQVDHLLEEVLLNEEFL